MSAMELLCGTAVLEITGAFPEDALNRLSRHRIPFRHAERLDRFTVQISAARRDAQRIAELARLAQCDCRCVRQTGLARHFRGLRYRALLVLAAALMIAALCVLPQFIWTLEVQGCETLHPEQVLRALESIGVGFGTWGPSVDIQTVKNHMLALLPELEWIAVNRSGGRATVLVHERVSVPEVTSRRGAVNLVAARTGIISRMEVYSGDAVVTAGQTVLRGELLVSGCLERTTGVSFTHAMAEVYARTWRDVTAVTPRCTLEKRETGRQIKRYALIIGKLRINFYTNSGISGVTYDKMTQTIPLTLPGGITLPLSLVEITCRAYETASQPVSEEEARTSLDAAVQACLARQLVGGSIEAYRSELQWEDACYQLRAVAECSEQIALEQAIVPDREEAENGENHKH